MRPEARVRPSGSARTRRGRRAGPARAAPTIAWRSAANATEIAGSRGWSGMRISSVPKPGCGRTSHQMRRYESASPRSTSRSTKRLPVGVRVEDRRRAGAREQRQQLGARRGEPGLAPLEPGRVGGDGQQGRQPGKDELERRHARLGALDPDVDVQPAAHLPLRRRARVLANARKPGPGVISCSSASASRPGRGGRDGEPGRGRARLRLDAQLGQLGRDLLGRRADAGVQLDDRAVELRLEPRAVEELAGRRGQARASRDRRRRAPPRRRA